MSFMTFTRRIRVNIYDLKLNNPAELDKLKV